MVTKKLYDIDAYATEFEARVISCEEKECINPGGDKVVIYHIVLDQTLFFPEEGGQTPDKGTLDGIDVLDVQIKGGKVFHYVAKPIKENSVVKGQINWKHRFSNMQQHSAEHIFSGLAHRKYGMKNVGFHLSDNIVTMDFDGVLTETQLQEMEWEVNNSIVANVEIKAYYPSKDALADMDYRSKIEIDGDVRIVEIIGYDVCACCAPHVHRTGEIGMFKIQSVQNYKGGMRISFLSGFRALEEYCIKAEIIRELSGILTTNQENIADHVNKLKTQVYDLKTQLSSVKQNIMENKIAEIPWGQKDVILFEKDLEIQVVRNTVNKLMERHEGLCGIFVGDDETGYNFIMGSKNINCCDIAANLKKELNARGGGKPQMIQGSVLEKEEVIKRVLL